VGASGGLLVAWKSHIFSRAQKNSVGFSIVVEFSSRHNDSVWTLLNVYGPCTSDGKREFTTWLKNVDIPEEEDWIILGDFNLYRHPEDRNRERADINDMFLFNSTISHLGLSKIPLQGRKYHYKVFPLMQRPKSVAIGQKVLQ
jgi:hypothetical protein